MKSLLLVFILSISFGAISQDDSKFLTKGKEQFESEQYESALKNFEKEFKKNKSAEIKFWIASCYFKMKKIPEAKQRFLEILDDNAEGPEIGLALSNLGSCYRTLHQLDSAIFYYDKALELDPKNDVVFYNKGQLLYYEQGNFDAAKECYNAAIKIEPNDWYYYQKRLEVNFASTNYADALNDLLFIRKMNPEAKNEMNLAYCYTMLEMYSEADSIFQIIYDENDPLFLNNYGFNQFKLGNSELAIETINKSLAIKPENSYAHRNLALIALENKNNSLACEHLRTAQNLKFKLDYGTEVNELIEEYCE